MVCSTFYVSIKFNSVRQRTYYVTCFFLVRLPFPLPAKLPAEEATSMQCLFNKQLNSQLCTSLLH